MDSDLGAAMKTWLGMFTTELHKSANQGKYQSEKRGQGLLHFSVAFHPATRPENSMDRAWQEVLSNGLDWLMLGGCNLGR